MSDDFIPTQAAPADSAPAPTGADTASVADAATSATDATAAPTGTDAVDGAQSAPASETAKESQADEWTRRFEELSRKDAEMRERERALKDASAQARQIAELQQRLKENPLEAVAELGLTLDDVMNHQLNNGANDPMRRIEQLEKAYNEKLQTMETRMEQQRLQRMGEQWEAQFQPLLESDEYRDVKLWDGADDAVRMRVRDHYREHGEILPAKQALDEVRAEIKKRMDKFRSAGLFEPDAPRGPLNPAAPATQAPRPAQPTLTSSDASAPVRRTPMDDDEIIAQLAAKYSS